MAAAASAGDAALGHFANINHLMEPLMATATDDVLGTPDAKMPGQIENDGGPKLFTPWMA